MIEGKIVRRNIGLCIVFTILTCGIYGLYWLYCLADDVNTVTGRTDGTSGGLVLLFTILTCGIYGLYWMYQSGDAMDQLRIDRQQLPGHLGIIYLVLDLLGLGIISYALLQSELNNYAQL